MKFKSGDKIRVKKEHKKAFSHLTEDLTVKGYNVADCLLTDMGMFISDEWFEKVEDKKMFKAGDKVRLKNCVVDGYGTVMSQGFCGIVEKVEGENVYLKNIFYPFFKARDLEKVEEKEVEKLTLQEYADKYNCFTAQDEDGERYEYDLSNKPKIGCHLWNAYISEGYEDITDKTLLFGGDWKDSLCEPKKEKEMEFEIGKKYVVTYWKENLENSDFCNNPNNYRILVDYIPKSNTPFICVSWGYEDKYKNDGMFDTTEWKFAKPIPEYKPYGRPKLEWVENGDKVIHTGRVHRISSVGVRENGVWFVGLSFKKAYTTYLNMQQFLKECTWLDGSPCGDLNN